MTIAFGIDAYRHGWVAIVLRDGSFSEGLIGASLAEVVGRVAQAEAIGVDIPIGLPTRGPREADVAARRFVGPRRSSVFPTQPRAVWEAPNIATARRPSLGRAYPRGPRRSASEPSPVAPSRLRRHRGPGWRYAGSKPTGWEEAIYAFPVEKRGRSGSTRTVESYARMLWPFFRVTTPDQFRAADVLAYAHGIGASGRCRHRRRSVRGSRASVRSTGS